MLTGRRACVRCPPWLGETIRGCLNHEEQAIFGLLLAGIGPDEIADTLGLSATGPGLAPVGDAAPAPGCSLTDEG